jgi:hypothetical protein
MSKFPDKLKMKEQAEEDLYFAKQDRQLIKALRKKKLAEVLEVESKSQKTAARKFEQEFEHVSQVYRNKPKKRRKAYRKLIDAVLSLFGISNKRK